MSLKKMVRKITATNFDRQQETEADLTASLTCLRRRIDPAQLGYFLRALDRDAGSVTKAFEWISHPNSGERAAKIIKSAGSSRRTFTPALDDGSWERLRKTSAAQ